MLTSIVESGSSASLMKGSSKRKRTREELEEVKEEEDALKLDRQAFLQEMKRLKEENVKLEALIHDKPVDSKMRPPSMGGLSSKSSQLSSQLP